MKKEKKKEKKESKKKVRNLLGIELLPQRR